MKKKILMSLFTIAIVGALIGGGVMAVFIDTETSTGNSFTAGTLDLSLDGNNGTNTVEFTLVNMRPGNQPNGGLVCANVGSLNGTLNITSIVVTNAENGILEPEAEAGDTTDSVGELQDVVNIRMFLDYDGNGYIGTGETVFFNGMVGTLPSLITIDEPLNAGASVRIGLVLDWWPTPNDSQAMGDGMVLDFTFALTAP